MKKGLQKGISLLTVIMMLVSLMPNRILANEIKSDETGIAIESVDAVNESTITNLEELPSSNKNENSDEQVVVIYANSSENNIKGLSLNSRVIKSGEQVSDRVDVLTVNDNINIDEFIAELKNNPNVLAVDKNVKIEASAIPNDPEITNGSAWQFERIGADETWDKVSNEETVVVAVIDTGLNMTHPDMVGRTVSGYDYVTKQEDVVDIAGHGTEVSGCIAAVTNNGIGTAGVSGLSNVKIAPYRAGGMSDGDLSLDLGNICAAIMAAAKRPEVKVINMSFGTYNQYDVLKDAVKDAADAGKILVAAAGNDGGSSYSYPASYENVISVGATTSEDHYASFSEHNDKVDLSAPGENVLTTNHDGSYEPVSGTSISSPIVAGSCAVLLAADSSLSKEKVESILKETALDLGNSGIDNYYGNGMIQLDEAVKSVISIKPLKVDSLTTDKASGQYVNTDITITAAGADGTLPYQYKFYYQLGTETVTLQDFSVMNTASFKPAAAGTYTLYADVKDASGRTVTRSIDNYRIVANPVIKTLTTDKVSGQYVNTDITITATGADGTSPYQYKFYYQQGTATVTLQDFSSGNTASFKPTAAGSYNLYADVKDASGRTATRSIDNYSIVANPVIKTLTTDKVSGQYVNTDITITATGADGTSPYQYKFYYQQGTATVTLQDFSSGNTASFKPTAAGSYNLYADVKDASGRTATRSIDSYNIVANPVIKTLTTDKASGQNINTNINLTATVADGKVPYQYKFYYKLGTATVTIQDFSNMSSVIFKPSIVGTYTLCVDMKDAGGKTATKSIENYIVINNPIVKSFITDKSSGQYVNTSIKLTAMGTDGKTPYQYKFYYKLGTATVTIKNFSTTNIVTFKPTKAGVYILYVDMKDANGNTATKSVENYTIAVNPSVKNFATDKTSGQTTNTSIQLNAVGADGITPYQYKFYYKLGNKATILEDYSTTATATFKPIAAGTYTLYVDIKDAGGKTATKSITSYKIVNSLGVKSFITDKTSGQGVDTGIKLTATGSDGKTPYQYQFGYKLGLATTMINGFSTSNTATFKPTMIGIYTLFVTIRDGNGKTITKNIDNYSIVPNPSIKTFITDKVSGQGINTSIQLKAEGADGKTPYQYKFYYKLGTSTVTIKNFATANTATFKPTKPGSYTLWVDIKDATGKIGSASIADYTVIGDPSVKTFTTNKASGQTTNTDINLTATGADGKTPYQYKFSYKLGTKTSMIQDFGAVNSAIFRPTAAGTYTLIVEVKDANGKVSTKSITSYKVVNSLGVKSFTTDKASGQGINTSIKLSAVGSDGKTPYQYQFSYIKGSETTIIQNYSKTTTAPFKPSTVGAYTLFVTIKDVNGNTATKNIDSYSIVPDPSVSSFTTDKVSGQAINSSIKLTATGIDGKPLYQYKFYYKLGTKTVTIKNFAAGSTVTFKPAKAGSYTLCVDLKDANGKISTRSIANYVIK